MSEIKITKVLPTSVDIPSVGRANIFLDSTTNLLSYKDENDVVTAIGSDSAGFESQVLTEDVYIEGEDTYTVAFGIDPNGSYWNSTNNDSALSRFTVLADWTNFPPPAPIDPGTNIASYFKFGGVGGTDYSYGNMSTDPGGCTMGGQNEIGGVIQSARLFVNTGGLNYNADAGDGQYLGFTIATYDVSFNDQRFVPKGIEYSADYSANFTNRSIVDKEYVDNGVKKVVATTADTTTDFSNVVAGDFVVHIPATPGNAEFGVAPANGTSPFTAVVGDLYISFRP